MKFIISIIFIVLSLPFFYRADCSNVVVSWENAFTRDPLTTEKSGLLYAEDSEGNISTYPLSFSSSSGYTYYYSTKWSPKQNEVYKFHAYILSKDGNIIWVGNPWVTMTPCKITYWYFLPLVGAT